jgi:teichuronic acid biosynthesis glycosyltransferase TuaG
MDGNTDMPFFSVIIPCYNCRDMLAKAIASVQAQTFTDFEVLIVDNSSTDGTSELLDSIEDERFSWTTVQNHGVIALSRNEGMKRAKGDYLAFLDADDRWEPEKLEVVYRNICENRNAIVLCHDEWIVSNGRRRKVNRYRPKLKNTYHSLLVHGNCLSTSAVTVQRQVALAIGGFSEHKAYITVEDYDFWIRLSKEGDFVFIDEPLGEAHVHDQNTSGNFEKHADAYLKLCREHFLSWLHDHPSEFNLISRGIHRTRTVAAHLYLKSRCFQKARKMGWMAARRNPLDMKSWGILLLSFLGISK